MKRFGITCALLALSVWMALGQSPVPVMVNPTNNAVVVPDAFWPSNRLEILATLSLDESINSGEPNGSGATVHWSQLLGVPAELGGGGGSNFIAGVSADFEVLTSTLSLTNATGTGQILRSSVLSSYLQSATAASTYQAATATLGRLGGIGLGTAGDWLYRDAAGWTNYTTSQVETALEAVLDLQDLQGAVTGSGSFMRTRTGVAREIWIPANAMTPTSEPPTASTNTWSTTTDGQLIEAWDFSASTTNALNWTLALPMAWDGGTVKAKVAWKQVVAEATSTNRWAIGGGSVANGETAGNTLGTLVMLSAVGANDTNVVSITDATGAITIGGTPSTGHLTWFTIRRHPGDAGDNSSVLARLLGVHLQFTETATEPSAW